MRSRYLPLKMFVAYIVCTLLLALLGPVEYEGFEPFLVSAYMATFLAIFGMGYIFGAHSRLPQSLSGARESAERRMIRLFKICLALSLLYKLQEFGFLAAAGKLNLSLTSMGDAYVAMYADYVRGSGSHSVGFILGIFFYFPLLIAMILGAHYFRFLSNGYRTLVVLLFVLVFVVHTLGQGKQKQLGDITVFILSIMAVRLGAAGSKVKVARNRVKTVRMYFIASVMLAMALILFTLVLGSRYEALGIGLGNINQVAHPLIQYDEDHLVFTLFGSHFGFAAASFSGYLSQGYQGLSLAFQQPFLWTYGVGNSYALTMLLGMLGLPVEVMDSYPARVGLASGWGFSKWHTVFPWLASDLTFPGVLLFFSVYAYGYAQVWREAVKFDNPAAVLLFALLNLGLVFVPANNQLLHTPESVVAVLGSVLLWLSSRRKLNAPFAAASPVSDLATTHTEEQKA